MIQIYHDVSGIFFFSKVKEADFQALAKRVNVEFFYFNKIAWCNAYKSDKTTNIKQQYETYQQHEDDFSKTFLK